MRWGWPFGIYAVVVIAHLVGLTITAWPDWITKALLMPVLLACVLIVAFSTSRIRGRRAWWGVAILGAGIVASFLGDVLLGPSFVLGLACFAIAHLLYIWLFNGPARAGRIPWWTLAYVGALVVVAIVLWPHLGALRPLLIAYGLVLVATAMTSTRVNAITAWGGGLFFASDVLLAFRLFSPDFATVFPDPWQDIAIMALYCAGEGLIAFGVLGRLRKLGV